MSYAQSYVASHGSAVPAGAVIAPLEDHGAERRKQLRVKVLKGAKIIGDTGRTIFDCLVLDESSGGALVEMGALVPLPSEVTIQFSSGAKYRAEPRWTAGTKYGLRFVGPQIVSQETSNRLKSVGEILSNQGLPAAMETLRLLRFFDNSELRRIAEDAEAAHTRLDSVLSSKAIL